MTPERMVVLAAVGFVAAAIGSVTGGNSLILVPAMIMAGMDPKTAIATNMLAVTCLSASAGTRFLREGVIPKHPTLGLMAGAIPGSLLGAMLALTLADRTLRLVIAGAMLGMGALLVLVPNFGLEPRPTSKVRQAVGYAAATLWGIYGGLFSGGYTTGLTVGCVLFFGTTLVQAIGLTKLVNLVSSASATTLFAAAGRIDWPIGIILGVATALGGWFGAYLTLRLKDRWIRWIFVVVVAGLAVKLVIDTLRSGSFYAVARA